MATNDVFDTFRQQEYTGANRCVPCTVVNVVISAAVSTSIGVASPQLGVATFALFMITIYLRGYLIPGTPTLTKQYFPDQVLAWFDKDPTQTFHVYGDAEDVDAEDVLRRADALEECAGGDDLCLTPRFSEAWHHQIERLVTDADTHAPEQTLAELFDVSPARIVTQNRGRSFVATVDGDRVGQWESRAAFVADMTAERVLSAFTRGWNDVPVEQRSVLLRQLRVFLEWCPECGSAVRLAPETRSSCCRSWEVIAAACERCDARLFELKADELEAVDG